MELPAAAEVAPMSQSGRAVGIVGLCASVVLIPVITSLVLGVTAESKVVRALEHRVARVMQRLCERAVPAEKVRWCAPSEGPRERLRAWADDELDAAKGRFRVAGIQVGSRWTQEVTQLQERQVTGAVTAGGVALPDDQRELIDQGGGSPSAESALEWDPAHAAIAPDDAAFIDAVAHDGGGGTPAGVDEARVLVGEADHTGSVMAKVWSGERVALRWAGVAGRVLMRLGVVATVVATLHDLLTFSTPALAGDARFARSS
ncbi:MAG: hypothetical protein JWM18_11 [Chloroflexi bacterium]|nr:hypothetical protein [Chloroflexota bacterium]